MASLAHCHPEGRGNEFNEAEISFYYKPAMMQWEQPEYVCLSFIQNFLFKYFDRYADYSFWRC